MDTFDPKHIYSDAAKLARLKDKKLFLFDIDGTIAVGDTLYEEVRIFSATFRPSAAGLITLPTIPQKADWTM